MQYCTLLLLLALSCSPAGRQTVPPQVYTDVTDTSLHRVNGCWMMGGKEYSGYIVEKDHGMVVSRLPIVAGWEHGTAYGWYSNGRKKVELNYNHGNREGIQQGWYENGQQSFFYHFHADKYEGEQQSFFSSGHKWQQLHYVNGYEEGKQKTWNDSGRVINNFTVKKGKLYGVIGRYDCMSVIKK